MSRNGDLLRELLPLPAADPDGFVSMCAHELDQFDDAPLLDRAIQMLATALGEPESVVRLRLGDTRQVFDNAAFWRGGRDVERDYSNERGERP